LLVEVKNTFDFSFGSIVLFTKPWIILKIKNPLFLIFIFSSDLV
jgi:hypothetical protein